MKLTNNQHDGILQYVIKNHRLKGGAIRMTDTDTLRKRIQQSGLKYYHVAHVLGITPYGLQKKIENVTEFKASEIEALSNLLRLTAAERAAIFFYRKA